MFAPTDEDVELELGVLKRSWAPLPYIEYTRNVPGVGNFYSGLMVTLFFGSVIASVLLVSQVFNRTGALFRDPIWWVTLIILITITHGTLSWVNSTRHNRRRLGVFNRGIRFGKSILRFDEIDEVGIGGFKTSQEKNFPWLEKIRELRKPAYALVKDNIRALTLDFKRHDGTTVHWIGVMGMFKPEEIAEFLELLKPHVAGSSVTSGENATK